MKFAREWKQRYYSLDKGLRKYCLNYKSWKKKCKTLSIETLKADLECEFTRINKVFKASVERIEFVKYLPCYSDYVDSRIKSLYELGELNKKCLYKICKRIDKRKSSNIMLSWYRSLHSNYIQVWLTLHKEAKEPCPICFEECYKKTVIMKCGHYICHDCVMGMIGAKHIKGTTHNLISNYLYYHGNRLTCPLCRNEDAFQKFMVMKE